MTALLLNHLLPALLAALFHIGALVMFAWVSAQETRQFDFEKPVAITAELIVFEAKPKPAPPKPKPAPQPVEAKPLPIEPEPEPENEPPPPEPEPEPDPEPAFDEDRLLEDALDLAIEQEAAELAEDDADDAAMSYHMAIYRRIVDNWSRPVSARNGMRTDLIVHLVPTGDVANVTLVRSSGDVAFDRSAEQAIRRAGHFDVPAEPELFETHFRALPVIFSPQDLLR